MFYSHTHTHNVTPFIPEGVGRGAHYDSVLPLRNFSKIRKKPSNTLPDPGIEPETPCSAVALATTRPTRQSCFTVYVNIEKKIAFVTKLHSVFSVCTCAGVKSSVKIIAMD
ncbi:hypothetical protein SFRURICE_002611 [Spodoptera frugiperda]|nr:hypothetical protein SFRURICE_002611 [Spodoptera frugiperda]